MKPTPEQLNTTKRPVKTNGYKSNKLWARRDRKRAEAEERQNRRESRGLAQQLALISKRRGKSEREMKRLTAGVFVAPVAPAVVEKPKAAKPTAPKDGKPASKYRAKKAKE